MNTDIDAIARRLLSNGYIRFYGNTVNAGVNSNRTDIPYTGKIISVSPDLLLYDELYYLTCVAIIKVANAGTYRVEISITLSSTPSLTVSSAKL